RVEDLAQPRQPRRRRRVIRIGLPFRLADQVADRAPDRSLGDEIDVGIGIALPSFALHDPARLTAARIVAGARGRLAERHAFAVLAVFGERAVFEPLLIAQLDAGEIEHTVLHRREHLLTAAGARALKECGDDAEREMKAGAGIADLRAGDERRPVAETGRRSSAAGALRDVLIDLAVLVGAGAVAFHRRNDHARIE